MPTPYLSLCIPTYNRASYLKNSIETIICQNEFKTGKVEIVISDNASSDDTEKSEENMRTALRTYSIFVTSRTLSMTISLWH